MAWIVTSIKLEYYSGGSGLIGFAGTYLGEAQTLVPSWAVEKGAMGIMIFGMAYVISKLWNEQTKLRKEIVDTHKYYHGEIEKVRDENRQMIDGHLKSQVEASKRIAETIKDLKREG